MWTALFDVLVNTQVLRFPLKRSLKFCLILVRQTHRWQTVEIWRTKGVILDVYLNGVKYNGIFFGENSLALSKLGPLMF